MKMTSFRKSHLSNVEKLFGVWHYRQFGRLLKPSNLRNILSTEKTFSAINFRKLIIIRCNFDDFGRKNSNAKILQIKTIKNCEILLTSWQQSSICFLLNSWCRLSVNRTVMRDSRRLPSTSFLQNLDAVYGSHLDWWWWGNLQNEKNLSFYTW